MTFKHFSFPNGMECFDCGKSFTNMTFQSSNFQHLNSFPQKMVIIWKKIFYFFIYLVKPLQSLPVHYPSSEINLS